MKELIKAFTVEEIAEYLRLHPYTIRRLARAGKIPAFRAGASGVFVRTISTSGRSRIRLLMLIRRRRGNDINDTKL